MSKPKDVPVYRLSKRQQEQYWNGERVTGPVPGSGCLIAQALMLLGFTRLALGPSVMTRLRTRVTRRKT
jgi:hypothetical protein